MTLYRFNPTKLTHAINDSGMTKKVAAAHMDATVQQVEQWEQGVIVPNVRTLEKICRVLQKPPAFFFDAIPEDKEGEADERKSDCVDVENVDSRRNDISPYLGADGLGEQNLVGNGRNQSTYGQGHD